MSLLALVYKELKELLMEKTILIGIIVTPLLLFPLLSFSVNVGVTSSVQVLRGIPAVYVDEDGGEFSKRFQEILEQHGLKLMVVNTGENPLRLMDRYDVDIVILVSGGFSENLTSGRRGEVKLYTKTESISISNLRRVSMVRDVLLSASESLARELSKKYGIDYEFLKTPLKTDSVLVVKDTVFRGSPELLAQLFFSIFFGVPFIVLIVTMTTGTVAATSIGLEKEAKTLEILLTLPLSRMKILFSKLIGSVIIASLGAAAFSIGFIIYLNVFASVGVRGGNALMTEVINITSFSALLIGVVILLALFLTLGLGILMGTLAGDVRGGQQLSVLLIGPLILFPFFTLAFTELENLPTTIQLVLLADPFTHLLLALYGVLTGEFVTLAYSLAVMVLFTLAILGVATWFFNGERLITMRIRLGRRAGE